MKVVLAHSRYRTAGGEERHLEILERSLARAGHDVRRYERRVPKRRGASLAVGAGLIYRPSSGRQLSRLLGAAPADIVHFHNLMPMLTPSALRAAHRSGAAVVMTLHNYRFSCPAGTLFSAGRRHDDCISGSSLRCALRNPRGSWPESVAYGIAIEAQRRFALLDRWVDAFVAPAPHVAELFVQAGGPASKVHVIANGSQLATANDSAGSYALFAGRLSAEKGIQTLLAAAKLAPEVPLTVAGDGPLRAAVLDSTDSVSYVGVLGPAALTALRREAAFVIVPSECDEVLPFAAIEALADSRAVIATANGGLRQIVQHGINGLIVRESDPQGLAGAMTKLWRDRPGRIEMGRAGRAYAEGEFEEAAQTKKLLSLYDEVCR